MNFLDKLRKKKLNTNISELAHGVTKATLPPEREFDTSQKNIWYVLINPERAIEVRAWLKKNRMKALIMRGENGETMLHWAVMSEYGIIIDLVDAGISPNSKDRHGKTPMDWLLERYWYTCVEKEGRLNRDGQYKIKSQTEDLGVVLWGMGGRPSENNPESLDANLIAARGGLWWYIQLLYETYGLDSLRGWMSDKRSVMHAWILSENNEQKFVRMQELIKWGLSIDEVDANGRTCLWYAADAWKNDLETDLMVEMIPELLKLGADPDIDDVNGISPRNVLSGEKAEEFERLILNNSIH